MNMSDKRGIDFGLGRGYSGSQESIKLFFFSLEKIPQAARHMLGLQRVNFAGGPGKKKRSDGRAMKNFRGSQLD